MVPIPTTGFLRSNPMNVLPCRSMTPLHIRAVTLGLLLVMIAGLGGCGSSSKPSKPPKGKGATPPRTEDRFLGTIIDMCQPDRLGLDSSADQVASLLNRWWIRSGEAIDPANVFDEHATTLLEQNLPEQTLERAVDTRFDERDVEFIRDAQLLREIVDRALMQEDNPQVALFDWVVRNVELESATDAIPKTPYEILMFGRGTAEDRAWVFAELMRQMRLDTYIIKPADAGESGRWLIAVEDQNQLSQLFDPVIGVPVPSSPDASSLGDNDIASLKQIQQNENLWKSLYPAGSEGFDGKNFQTWDAFAIGSSSLWSARMDLLQQSVGGDTLSAVISQSIPEADRKLPSVKSIQLWAYPEQQLIGRYNTDKPLQYTELWLPFQMPFSVELADGSIVPGRTPNELQQNLILGRPLQLQLKARNTQLGGDLPNAIQQYINVRLQCTRMIGLPSVPTDVRRSHAEAFDDAYYWIGICQFELDRPEQAAQTFASYIDQFGDRGGHLEQARLMLAECNLPPEDRRKHLDDVPVDSPAKLRAEYLSRTGASDIPEKTPPETPVEKEASQAAGPAVAEKP